MFSELRQRSIPGGIGAGEEDDGFDPSSSLQKLTGDLECDCGSGAVAHQRVRTIRMEFANLLGEIGCNFFYRTERLTVIFEPRKL